jgi:hypothetical protein
MFPECRLLHEKLNAFNMIATKETCGIIVAKVVWISETFITHFVGLPKVDAYYVAHFVQHLNKVCHEVKLLAVAIVGFPRCSLIAALLKLYLTHEWANEYSSFQKNGEHGSISSLKTLKYMLLIGSLDMNRRLL